MPRLPCSDNAETLTQMRPAMRSRSAPGGAKSLSDLFILSLCWHDYDCCCCMLLLLLLFFFLVVLAAMAAAMAAAVVSVASIRGRIRWQRCSLSRVYKNVCIGVRGLRSMQGWALEKYNAI